MGIKFPTPVTIGQEWKRVMASSKRSCVTISTLALSIAAATASCHSGQANGSTSDGAKEIPVYRMRYGMTVDEFAAVNNSDDVETPGLGIQIKGPHIIVFEAEGRARPFVLRNVGRSANAGTSIAIDYNFEDIGASTIFAVSTLLDGGDDDSNMTFEQAERVCEQAVSGFEGTDWQDRTWWLEKTYEPEGLWLAPSRVKSDLGKMPRQGHFPRRQFINGELLAECVVSRNDTIATDLGYRNALGALGNDPSAPMYKAVLSIMSRLPLEPNVDAKEPVSAPADPDHLKR